jgi:acetyl-CoA acetyltransferase
MSQVPRRVAFVGTGTSASGRQLPGRTQQSLIDEAIVRAVDDAGLSVADIDGVISTFSRDSSITGETVGLHPTTWCMNNENGNGSTGFAVDVARWALLSERVRYVALVCGAKESATGRVGVGSNFQGRAVEGVARSAFHFIDLDHLWGATWLNQYAAIAHRHMHEFGTTVEQLAGVAVSNRYNASLNPEAIYRIPISIEDVLGSRMISTPLTMLMCSMVNDGAAAAIITTLDRARDLRHTPVEVIGSGSAFTGYTLTKAAIDPRGQFDMLHTVGRLAADEAFGRAGVARSDIDVFTCADPFVIYTIMAVEDYGFCAKGEGGRFIGDGTRTRVGGPLPINTHGGLTSGNHAHGSHGALVEAVRQLQGVGGDRQVSNAELALFAAMCGKVSTHSLHILARSQ